MSHLSLDTWLPVTLTDVTSEGAVGRFELWAIAAESDHRKLDTIALLPVDERTDEYALQLVGHIRRLAQTEADCTAAVGGGTVTKCSVLAFRGDSENPDSSCPFIVHGVAPARSTAATLDATSEPATEKGITATIQRHAEGVLRMHMAGFESLVVMQARALEQSERRREAAEQRALETMALRTRLQDREHEREIEMMREKNRERWKGEIVDTIKTFAPHVIAGLPQANKRAVVGNEAVELAKSITQDEISAVAKLDLSPEVRERLGKLVALAQALAREEAKKEPKH